jgi:hypothetical protein
MVVARIGVDELYERAALHRETSRSAGRRHCRRWDASEGEQDSGNHAPSRVRRRSQEISNDHLTRGFNSKGLNGALGTTTVQLCVLWQVAQSCVVSG